MASPSPHATAGLPPIEAAYTAIRSMAVRGATAISVAAATAFADAAQHVARAQPADWRRRLKAAARRLATARPTAVPLENALAAVATAALAERDVRAAARAARAAAQAWQRDIAAGRAAIVALAPQAIGKRRRVLTHCHSSTVVALLAEAWREGRVDEVIATETRPWRQGLVTTAALAQAGVPCRLVVDSAAGHVLREGLADVVLVGADTVCRDGTLVNKVGTATVALCARDANVPVLSVTLRCKFTARRAEDVPIEERAASEVASPAELAARVGVLNPVFDRTPAAWLSRYVTQDGCLPPSKALAAARPRIPKVMPW